MFAYILRRLGEPSTYAGLSGLGAALGLSDNQWQTVGAAIGGVAALVAMILSERQKPHA